MHFRTDLSLWLDNPMFSHVTPTHVHLLPAVFFEFHPKERWGTDVQLGNISRMDTPNNMHNWLDDFFKGTFH